MDQGHYIICTFEQVYDDMYVYSVCMQIERVWYVSIM